MDTIVVIAQARTMTGIGVEKNVDCPKAILKKNKSIEFEKEIRNGLNMDFYGPEMLYLEEWSNHYMKACKQIRNPK